MRTFVIDEWAVQLEVCPIPAIPLLCTAGPGHCHAAIVLLLHTALLESASPDGMNALAEAACDRAEPGEPLES